MCHRTERDGSFLLGFFLIALILFAAVHHSFAQDYIVGEGDVMRISVYDHDDLTTTARISGDGGYASQPSRQRYSPCQTRLCPRCLQKPKHTKMG